MKYVFLICFLSLYLNLLAQDTRVEGLYIGTIKDNVANGCCKLTTILQLKSNHTFSIYQNDNQGDYVIESISEGDYKVKRNSISFLPIIDSAPNRYSFNWKYNQLSKVDSDLKTFQPVHYIAGSEAEHLIFQKINLKKIDSISFYIMNDMDSTWNHEKIVVIGNKIIRYIYKDYNFRTKLTNQGENKIALSEDKYNEFLKIIVETSLFEKPKNPDDLRQTDFGLNIHFKNRNISIGGHLLSQNVYRFLFSVLTKGKIVSHSDKQNFF